MPWCPQCGAEYREGFTECAKCEVALEPEQPDVAQPKGEIRIPRFLQRPVRDVKRAWGYGVEAARVLRKWPVLLLIPLVLAVTDAGERAVGQYRTYEQLMARQLGAADAFQAASGHTLFSPRSWRRQLANAKRRSFSVYRAANRFASPVTGISLVGTWQVSIVAGQARSVHGLDLHGEIPQSVIEHSALVHLVMLLLLGVPLTAAISAGYYHLVKGCVEGALFSWGRLGLGVRLWFVRFFAFSILVGLPPLAVATAFSVVPRGREITPIVWRLMELGPFVWNWVMLVALVSLGLTLVAVVADDRRLASAVGASIRTVAADIGITMILVLSLYVLLGLLTFPLNLLGTLIWGRYSTFAMMNSAALSLGTAVIGAIIGTWFLLVQFLWYRDASAAFRQSTEQVSSDLHYP